MDWSRKRTGGDQMIGRRRGMLVVLCMLGVVATDAQAQLTLDFSEPEFALAYLDAPRGSPSRDSLWARIRSTTAFRRLGERERGMGRDFEDNAFRAFLESDTLARRRESLRATLRAWAQASAREAEELARRYLPAGTPIRATVHVMIKPRPNSFVFDLERDPAIFLYLDPALSAASFRNTVTHELHHVGYSAACRAIPDSSLPPVVRRWLSAFGEGWAMLAAAGDAASHPHATSDSISRARWDAALQQAPTDLVRLGGFFHSLLDGALTADAAQAQGMAFFSERPQGPWYTVGWLMTSTVERVDGHAALMRTLCDPVALLRAYQRIAPGMGAPQWDARLITRLTGDGPPPW